MNIECAIAESSIKLHQINHTSNEQKTNYCDYTNIFNQSTAVKIVIQKNLLIKELLMKLKTKI
mgnify:CR=1 FL=1